MVEALDLLVVLAVLYMMECVWRVEPDDVVADTTLSGRRTLKKPLCFPSERWGWVLLNPFRPFRSVYRLRRRPWTCLSQGVLALGPPGRFHAYTQCINPRVNEDGDVTFADGTAVHTGSVGGAGECARMISRVAGMKSADRPGILRQAESVRFDVEAIHRSMSSWGNRTRRLRRIVALQAALCFVVFPSALVLLPAGQALLLCLAPALAASAAAAVEYWHLVDRGAQARLDLYGNVVKLALYPIASLRAMDVVSADVLAGYDAIAVTAALVSRNAAAQRTSTELVRLRYQQVPDEAGEEFTQAMNEYRRARIETLEWFDQKEQLMSGDLLSSPPREGSTSMTYCPNCRAQYALADGLCTDCPGMRLQQFA